MSSRLLITTGLAVVPGVKITRLLDCVYCPSFVYLVCAGHSERVTCDPVLRTGLGLSLSIRRVVSPSYFSFSFLSVLAWRFAHAKFFCFNRICSRVDYVRQDSSPAVSGGGSSCDYSPCVFCGDSGDGDAGC